MWADAGAFLTEATSRLRAAGIQTARLDCLILLEDATKHNRAHLLAHPEMPLTRAQQKILHDHIAARTLHTPLAYIRGKAYFYGREFVVDKHVLVPRPETEAMIDLLKTLPLTAPRIADIGTGSGCIAITAALELPAADVHASDIDGGALAVANRNAAALHAAVSFTKSDLLGSIPEDTAVILANLPYVPDGYSINQAAGHEPRIALFAGHDGLDVYRRLWQHMDARAHQPRFILTESLEQQHNTLRTYAHPAGYAERDVTGLIQLFERI